MEIADYSAYDLFFRLAGAVLLGGTLGLQRNLVGKVAGMRTFALVSLGSALFVTVAQLVSLGSLEAGRFEFDPLRVASQVVVGIGFIGGGLIVFKDRNISGLTTAAGLWVAAGIGLACGYGLYFIALTAALLALLIFTLMWHVEQALKRIVNR